MCCNVSSFADSFLKLRLGHVKVAWGLYVRSIEGVARLITHDEGSLDRYGKQ